jgi:hypothetical protein
MKLNTLYIKGLRRIKKELGKYIPNNTRFKPAGVCLFTPDDTSSLIPNEIHVHPIYRNSCLHPALITGNHLKV